MCLKIKTINKCKETKEYTWDSIRKFTDEVLNTKNQCDISENDKVNELYIDSNNVKFELNEEDLKDFGLDSVSKICKLLRNVDIEVSLVS